MKKIVFAFLLTTATSSSCKKDYPGDTFDFSNALPPYVALKTTDDITVSQDTSVSIGLVMRTALQQIVTVTYDVTGAINKPNQTVNILRDKTTSEAVVVIPGNVITTPGSTATATVKLLKAVTADGKSLTIGQTNDIRTQMVTINITE